MARGFLDSHVVIRLYVGEVGSLSRVVRGALNAWDEVLISPLVRLELHYLKEIGRLATKPETLLRSLSGTIGLRIEDCSLEQLSLAASEMTWTRDPFDRLITAQASLDEAPLVTKNRTIRAHYRHAMW